MREHLLPTIFAFSAGADAGNKNPVSRFECGHGSANILNNTDTLMTQNATGSTGRDVALEDVQVGPADRGFHHLDDGVRGRLDLRLRVILQGFFARPPIDKTFHRLRLLRLESRAAGFGIVVRVMVCNLSRARLDSQKIVVAGDLQLPFEKVNAVGLPWPIRSRRRRHGRK